MFSDSEPQLAVFVFVLGGCLVCFLLVFSSCFSPPDSEPQSVLWFFGGCLVFLGFGATVLAVFFFGGGFLFGWCISLSWGECQRNKAQSCRFHLELPKPLESNTLSVPCGCGSNYVPQMEPKKQKNTNKNKTILAPTMAGILWVFGFLVFLVFLFFFFVFLVQGNVAQQIPHVAQHLRIMRGYVNLCERRHVLGERICEFYVEKSY